MSEELVNRLGIFAKMATVIAGNSETVVSF